jgi:hypothetical protein
VLRTDTANFNRFLTSLGLLFMVAALVIPYFYFRETGVLRISQGELHGLTPSSRGTLEARQERIGDLEIPAVVVSALLAFGGATALVFGGRRLRVAQRKEDEAIDRRAKREDYEIQELSTDEVEEKRTEQAREAVGEEAAGEAESAASPAAPPRIDEEGLPTPPTRYLSVKDTRLEIARVEEKMNAVLEGEGFEKFRYRHGVRIVPEGSPRQADVSPRQAEVDALFSAEDPDRSDIALELKVTRLGVRSLKSRVRAFTDPMLALLSRYNRVTGRGVMGWLLVLVPEGAERLSPRERVNVELHFEQGLAGLGRCTVLHEDDLPRLPEIFRNNFE